MADQEGYIQAFSHYMRSGDADLLKPFLGEKENTAFLRIYRNGFYKACMSALKANFISLTHLLNEEEFNQIATQYINHYPPVQATLVAYGMDDSVDQTLANVYLSFPDFLAEIINSSNPPMSYAQSDVLYDVAVLDQSWFRTLNSVNQNVVDLSQVQTMLSQGQDLSDVPFKLVGSVTLVSTQYQVFSHWQALRFEGEVPHLPIEKQACHILFWQYEGEVQAKLLNPVEWCFYHTFFVSGVMNDALEAASQLDEELDISALFADLLNASLLKLEG